MLQVVLAVTGFHSSEGLPLVSPLIKAKWEVVEDVGDKVKAAFVKKWEAVKATGCAVGSVIAAPFHIVYKSIAIKLGSLRSLLGFKGNTIKKIIVEGKQKLNPSTTEATTTTTSKLLPSKDLHHFVPVVFSNLHKNHFISA